MVAAPVGVASGPVGTPVKPGKQILLMIVTFGIYGIIWNYHQYQEIKRYCGEGPDEGFMQVLLSLLSIVSVFYIPSLVEKMYKREGQTSPVSAATGCWMLLIYPGLILVGVGSLIGPIIWYTKVQKALNEFWIARGAQLPV